MDGQTDGWRGMGGVKRGGEWRGRVGKWWGRDSRERWGVCGDKWWAHRHLFFRLSFLYHVPPDFDTWGQDGSGEICHINPHEVANFLSSWMEERGILSTSPKRRLGKEGTSRGVSVMSVHTSFSWRWR